MFGRSVHRRQVRVTLFSLLVAAAFVATGVGPTQASPLLLQPGDQATTGVGQCTLNFVFDGVGAQAGKVYIGIAAHCVDGLGDVVNSPSFPAFGTVAYYGVSGHVEKDVAFIEVKPEYHGSVFAGVVGNEQYPVGHTTPVETTIGDLVQVSGWALGYSATPWTREERVAVLNFDNTRDYGVSGPIHWGDSGGPLVHIPTGKALGIVSQLCIGFCTETGPTVQGMIDQAAADGFTVQLRTV